LTLLNFGQIGLGWVVFWAWLALTQVIVGPGLVVGQCGFGLGVTVCGWQRLNHGEHSILIF